MTDGHFTAMEEAIGTAGDPHRVQSFFEALIADNLDLGRPENVEIIFGRRVRCDTPGIFRTAIDRPVIDPDDKAVVVNIFYKHSRVKHYTKLHNRLLRPLMAADQPQAPPGLRQALRVIDRHVDDYISRARLPKAA